MDILNLGLLRELPVLIPPVEEQHEIVRRVEALFALADRVEARYNTARARVHGLTPALLAKAFRGELVPQDPNDEPASVLLERIRTQRTQEAASAKRTSRAPQRSKTGKKWSRLEPQQLTLAEVLITKGKPMASE